MKMFDPFIMLDLYTNQKNIVLNKIINNKKIYKFISLTKDHKLNEDKITTLKLNCVWLSAPYTFEDKTEFCFPIDFYGKSIKEKAYIKKIENITSQLDCVTCFTNSIRENMWSEYGNNHSGICCEYEIISGNDLHPVIYTNKNNLNLNKILFNNNKVLSFSSLAILPAIIKDNFYKEEREIRFFSGDFIDRPEYGFNGFVDINCMKKNKFYGYNVTCETIGIKINKVILGNQLDDYYIKKISDVCTSLDIEIEDE